MPKHVGTTKEALMHQKNLLFLRNNRGMKEVGLILRRIKMDDLEKYENFLKEDDANIFDWFFGKQPCPQNYNTLINALKENETHSPS